MSFDYAVPKGQARLLVSLPNLTQLRRGDFLVDALGKLMYSVSDPFHFDMDPDPDPRIRFVK